MKLLLTITATHWFKHNTSKTQQWIFKYFIN